MPETPEDDAALAAAAVSGSRTAFSDLVRRHQGVVFRIARRILKDDGEAADAAQEAFLKAFKNLASFDRNRPFAPWLYRIARNHALDVARSKGVAIEVLERAGAADDADDAAAVGAVGRDVADESAPDPVERISDAETKARIAGAMGTLDAKYREVIELYHFEELTYDEIAHTLGVPIGTVMTRIHRARARLAEALKPPRAPRPERRVVS